MSFGWLRRWLPLLLPAAESAWLIPWLLFLSGAFYPDRRYVLAPLAVAVLLLGGFLLAYVAEVRLPPARAKGVVLALSVALGLWAVWTTHYRTGPVWHPAWVWDLLRAAHDAFPQIPAPVVGAVAAPLVLWRGLVLGGREYSHFTAEQAFRRGVVWSVFFALLFALYRGSPVFVLARPVAAGYLLTFLFLSLLQLTVARLLGIWEESRGKDPRALAFNRPWFATAVGVTVAIVGLSALLGGLAGADIWPYLAPALKVLAPLLEAVFLILFLFASLIARALLFLISRLPWRGRLEPITYDPIGDALRAVRDLQVAPEIVSRARWGMVALAVLLLSLVILYAIARRRRRAVAVDEDDRESVWDPWSLMQGLRRLFVRRRSWRGALDDRAGTPEAQTVRLVYRRLLRAAAEAGHPRRMDQTAREFQRAIEPATGEAAPEMGALTAVYEAVRYGGHRPSRADVAAAQGWLERLRAALQPRGPARS